MSYLLDCVFVSLVLCRLLLLFLKMKLVFDMQHAHVGNAGGWSPERVALHSASVGGCELVAVELAPSAHEVFVLARVVAAERDWILKQDSNNNNDQHQEPFSMKFYCPTNTSPRTSAKHTNTVWSAVITTFARIIAMLMPAMKPITPNTTAQQQQTTNTQTTSDKPYELYKHAKIKREYIP